MWPFKKKNKVRLPPEQQWAADYAAWLEDMYLLLGRFPDHAALEGRQLPDSQWQLLDQISDLYSEDLRLVIERMALKNESLRRTLKPSDAA